MQHRGRGSSAALTILLLALPSCDADPRRSPPDGLAPELTALHSMIQRHRVDYERGLELIVSGEPVAGRNLLAASSDRIAAAGELCARTVGCDVTLFSETLVDLPRNPPTPGSSGEEPVEVGEVGVPEIQRTVALLGSEDLRELIPVNDRVRAALNEWLTWKRPQLIDAYENYRYLSPHIAPVYREAGLPEALLFAMMAKEAGGKVHAWSRAGAAGPLQFMPHTARRYGLGSVRGFDMRLDPVAATRANVAYLNDQLALFNDDLEKVLAAYNVGEGRLRRLDRRSPGADFWDPAIYDALPRETRRYVPQVMAAALLFLDPGRYGLEFPDVEASTTTIVLAERTSLGELTVCLGQSGSRGGWFRTLRNLNPRLDPEERIPARTPLLVPSELAAPYAEHCVGDSPRLVLARQLHDGVHPNATRTLHYTVRAGDTLVSIAEQHGCRSVRRLADYNGIAPPEFSIRIGQRITVPACG